MSTSMMLRNGENRIVGYVLLDGTLLYIRIKGDGEQGTLTLLTNPGTQEEVAVICDGCEREARCLGTRAVGAYVQAVGRLIASTDEEARSVFERDHPREKQGETASFCKKEDIQCKKEGTSHVYHREEGRWPPPACWPGARYCCGVWTDADA